MQAEVAKSKLVVGHQNVRSLRNCVDKIENLASVYCLDVICITEHWLNSDELHKTGVMNFNLSAEFCRSMCQCGGVAIFTRSTISSRPRLFGILECAAAELNGNLKNYIIIAIYRPPKDDFGLFLQLFDTICCIVYNEHALPIICGDFNIDTLTGKNSHSDILLGHLATFNLKNLISEPVAAKSQTCIDHVFVPQTMWVEADVVENHIADHKSQIVYVKDIIEKTGQGRLDRRFSNEAVLLSFIAHLSLERWDQVFCQIGTNNKWNSFQSVFLYYFNLYFPLKRSRETNSSFTHFQSPEIKEFQSRLGILNILKNKYPECNKIYSEMKIEYGKLLREAKSGFI